MIPDLNLIITTILVLRLALDLTVYVCPVALEYLAAWAIARAAAIRSSRRTMERVRMAEQRRLKLVVTMPRRSGPSPRPSPGPGPGSSPFITATARPRTHRWPLPDPTAAPAPPVSPRPSGSIRFGLSATRLLRHLSSSPTRPRSAPSPAQAASAVPSTPTQPPVTPVPPATVSTLPALNIDDE